MRPVETKETNHNFGPPPGMEDKIGNLPCRFGENHDLGMKFVFAVYEPSDDERLAIADGQNIRIGIGWLGAFPPVSLGITHLQAKEETHVA